MYHYGKPRGRATLSPKDNHLFGPQFSLQASATTVSERPPKQGILGNREVPSQLKTNEIYNNASPIPRRSASSHPSENLQFAHSSERSSSGHHSHLQHHVVRNTGLVKRQILPATAYAHDLTNPDPLPSSDIDHDTRSTLSSQNSVRSTGLPKAPVFLPGDRVVFAESPSSPGVPIVYRTPEERSANPDRLNLDRRRLTVCPMLEGEDQLRLLNYQHNMIGKIEHLNSLRRLIFLDLYDNQIDEISGLQALKSLRVLMLGKNRIRKIEHLDSLTKLDVLDLHGNQINQIENLNHLSELRVLNLAGNLLDHVDNLVGMDALTELNLRRNHIRTVSDVDNLPNLQRLFLSFNEISSFDDIACLGESHSISEISLDGNPFAQEQAYKQTVLRHMNQLRQLDMKRISEDERRIASVMARKEVDKKRETTKMAVMKERRRLAISNARRQWEVMQGSMMGRTNRLIGSAMPELVANHIGSVPNSEMGLESPERDGGEDTETQSSRSSSRTSRPTSAKSIQSDREVLSSAGRPSSTSTTRSLPFTRGTTPKKKKVPTGGPVNSNSALNVDYLAELEGDTLSLYGAGALDALDKNWGIAAAGAVTTVVFKFIDFDEIAGQLHKVRARFPTVHTLYFNSTNICHLSQLNALSALRRLDNLNIDADGNPVTEYTLWRSYALFRLAHFSLKKINDVEVSASDIVNAEKFFSPLGHITTSQLPHARLVSLLGETKRKQLQVASEEKSRKSPDTRQSDRSSESVGRAGLVYTSQESIANKTQDQKSRRQFVKTYIKDLTQDAIAVDQKRTALRKIWPQVFAEMVQNVALDMWDRQAYMKRCMEDLTQEKS